MRKSYFLLTILIFSFFIIFPEMTQGASLYLSPSAGSYTVGNTFLAQINVNTGGLAVNAAEGTLVFDSDRMEVASISKTSSVFSLWVQEPEFSNALGTINFAGGKPSPGYSGASGIIMNVTFKAKRAGVANLTFAAGSVLADDGKGTNVLSQLGDGKYTLDAMVVSPIPVPPTSTQPPTSQKTPGLPEVFSITHPEGEKWYSNNDPEFTWILPVGVTDVSLLLHENPTGNPGPISNGKIEIKKYENIKDGVWYFHIRFKNSYGWGSILHRKVLIDTVA
ncbi:MAG: cohesin domain-containing protein, partial [Candidatus Nealsonbacteria bacterium]